jgi:adiponectin receptor
LVIKFILKIILIGSSFLCPLFYALKCFHFSLYFYLTIIISLTILNTIIFNVPKYNEDKYRYFRIILLSSFALFGIIPILHTFQIYGLQNEIINNGVKKVILTYILYGIGLFFYFSRLPERCSKKAFNM